MNRKHLCFHVVILLLFTLWNATSSPIGTDLDKKKEEDGWSTTLNKQTGSKKKQSGEDDSETRCKPENYSCHLKRLEYRLLRDEDILFKFQNQISAALGNLSICRRGTTNN
ncbi:unnamed protein product [Calicophoron daubneyi]|uniref:Uncharacterized protein n=1 Tax=Calicophoron daubneyi TaxID=300641 RepID=A0AAV2T1L3_CALDB